MAVTTINFLLSVLSLISLVHGGFKFGGLTLQQVNTQLSSLLLPQINQLRASVHPAPDTPLAPLEWDNTLATAAGQWASKCILNDNSDSFYAGKVGESITIVSIRDFVKGIVSAGDGISIWSAQNATYDYHSDACFQGAACADYRQLVWDNTKKVGCATNICNKKANLVCQYYPPGDAVGVRPFHSSSADSTALQVDLTTGAYDKVEVNETGNSGSDGSKRSPLSSKRAVVRGTNNYGDACNPTTERPQGQCSTMDDCANSNGRYAYWGSNICGGGDNVICCIRDTPYVPPGSPTSSPTKAPAPTPSPTKAPTTAPPAPTNAPPAPTTAPPAPTPSPTKAPTSAPPAPTSAPTTAPKTSLTLPTGIYSWRGTQAVTPIKNQKSCGSCWTFASAAAAESAWAIKTGGTQLDLSEQRLVDCVTQSNGCNGGNAESALPYIVQNGETLEASFPYTAVDTADCPTNIPFNAPAKWTGYKVMSDKSVEGVKQALRTYGPMVVYVYADDSWQRYSGGVLSGTYKDINHAVLLVGYDASENAWIIKNSWGTSWGDGGFIHVDVNNNFGMSQWGPYAITA